MRRLPLPFLLSLLLSCVLVAPALAGFRWCAEDPVVSIAGRLVTIEVRVPEEHVDDLRGPVRVEVAVPEGVEASVVSVTNTFFQEEVEIVPLDRPWQGKGPIPAEVRVVVPSEESFLVEVDLVDGVVGNGHPVRGRSNREVKVPFRVEPVSR